MRVLAVLTEFFINAFQITRPRPGHERRAQFILGGLTLLVLLLILAATLGMLLWAFRA